MWVCNLVCHLKGRTQLRTNGNRVLRKIFRHKRGEVTGDLTKLNCIMWGFVMCAAYWVWFGQLNQG
jgi:hypothetical protein